MLATYLDLLACPTCKSALAPTGDRLQCGACQVTYSCVSGTDCLVLLPAAGMGEEPGATHRKEHVRQRFAAIHETLSSVGHGQFATFLNLGYAADGSPQRAVRGPVGSTLNRFSTTLLFEVVGGCDLDGRITVELGCGRGGNLALLQEYYTPRTLLGVDLSPVNVAFCCQRHRRGQCGFVVGDVEYLPVRSGRADVVLNLESSHYYPDIERFFAEVSRVLVPGGTFLYADILPEATFALARRCLERLGCRVERDDDISANVLRSCEAVARLRTLPRYSKLYEMFDVVPGSAVFESLRAGDARYRILSFRRM